MHGYKSFVAGIMAVLALAAVGLLIAGAVPNRAMRIVLLVAIVPLAGGACLLYYGRTKASAAFNLVVTGASLFFLVQNAAAATNTNSASPKANPSRTASPSTASICPGVPPRSGHIEALARWSALGNAASYATATSLVTIAPPGDYNLNGWILEDVGLCDYDLTFTATVTTPTGQGGTPGDGVVGWGYGVGVCLRRPESGALQGAMAQIGFLRPDHVPDDLQVVQLMAAPEYVNSVQQFVDPQPFAGRLAAGSRHSQDWHVRVRHGTVTADVTRDGVAMPRLTWPATGSLPARSAQTLPQRCGPGGGDDVAIRVWGARVEIANPVVTTAADDPAVTSTN